MGGAGLFHPKQAAVEQRDSEWPLQERPPTLTTMFSQGRGGILNLQNVVNSRPRLHRKRNFSLVPVFAGFFPATQQAFHNPAEIALIFAQIGHQRSFSPLKPVVLPSHLTLSALRQNKPALAWGSLMGIEFQPALQQFLTK